MLLGPATSLCSELSCFRAEVPKSRVRQTGLGFMVWLAIRWAGVRCGVRSARGSEEEGWARTWPLPAGLDPQV